MPEGSGGCGMQRKPNVYAKRLVGGGNMTEKKIRELIADMTVEEKAGQLLQVAGNFYSEKSLVTGALDYFKITEDELSRTGSILSISGAKKLKGIQDMCMSKQPHHIPQVFMLDIINGYETIYPVPLAQGATFDPEMAEKLAEMAAKEGAAAGVHVTFSPMCDLVRDARWGRVMESTGEDPYLNGLMGAAMVRGYQGKNVKNKGRLASCVKHFAAYGAGEGGRDYDNVELSERTLRDQYLPAYEEAVKAGARLVMTSFNTLDHIPSTANKWLMKDVLRGEMGFDGMLITDYGASQEMINHNIAKDWEQAAELALKAGVDMDMMSFCYVRGIKKLLEDGRIGADVVDEAVYRVLSLKNELGLFENPYKDASEEDEKKYILCEKHRKLACEAAAESFVLLENRDGILPLDQAKKGGGLSLSPSEKGGARDFENAERLAFIGPFADCKKVYGSWSFPSDDADVVSIKEGVKEYTGEEEYPAEANAFPNLMADMKWLAGRIEDGEPGQEAKRSPFHRAPVFCTGSHFFGEDKKLKNGEFLKYDKKRAKEWLKEAVREAKSADKVIMCIGEHAQQTGEAASRTQIRIPEEQMKLLRAVAKVNKNIITLVFTGRPLELEEVKKLSKAVMVVWFPGTECGNAVAKVLFGEKEPGGRLPMSFPYTVAQMPCYYNRFRSGRPNDGTLDRSYVMGYIDQVDKMLYPFGYGKTYTEFRYGKVKLEGGKAIKGRDKAKAEASENGSKVAKQKEIKLSATSPVTASVTLKNIGKRTGTETVQLYVADLFGSVVRSVKELKGIRKVTLAPGESTVVSFEVTEEMFRFHNIDMEFTSEPGECRVWIGADSETENGADLVLE